MLVLLFFGTSLPISSAFAQQQSSRRIADMVELPAYLRDRPEQVIFHKAYTVSYNSREKIPNWVAWVLTKDHIDGPYKRSNNFMPDPKVKAYCPKWADYKYSGYDRGHMCPSNDNKWNQEAMDECFYMSNICPQTHGLNDGTWKKVESLCHHWANNYGKIYIVCGPIIQHPVRLTIGGVKKITVPDQFYKIVMRYVNGKPQAIAYVFQQKDVYRITTVDEVEQLTGINFFHRLSRMVQAKMEATYHLQYWPRAQFKQGAGDAYRKVYR